MLCLRCMFFIEQLHDKIQRLNKKKRSLEKCHFKNNVFTRVYKSKGFKGPPPLPIKIYNLNFQ